MRRGERLGAALPPRQLAAVGRDASAARAALGEATFAAAWAEGRQLAPEAAWAEAAWVAQSVPDGSAETAPSPAGHGLTPREVEVLRLLVEGRSDREIGAALFISPRTAMTHVRHIFDKLGVNTRRAARDHAVARRLV